MDNVNGNEQNSEMSASSMHEVPLASNEEMANQADAVQPPIGKIPSKNGSLKRFFKLSTNKKSGGGGARNAEADAGGMEADTEEEENDRQTAEMVKLTNEKNKVESKGKAIGNENDLSQVESNATTTGTASKPQSLSRVRSRRFNFRFGNNTEADVAVAAATPASSSSATAASRHSLRSSLSTYFNSVFKRKHGANSKHALRTAKKKDGEEGEQDEDDENDNDNESRIEMLEPKAWTVPPPQPSALVPQSMPEPQVHDLDNVAHKQPVEVEQQLPNLSIPEDISAAVNTPEAQN